MLAGGRCSTELAQVSGVEERWAIPFGGRPVLEIVLECVRQFGEPMLVGGPEGAGLRRVPPGRSFVESLQAGLRGIESGSFLLATSDLPFLTAEAVSDFLGRCSDRAILNYPIVSTTQPSPLSDIARTSLRLREGKFTGGNIALMDTELMRRALPHLERAYASRKSPFKLGRQIGLGVVLRLALGKLAPRTLRLGALETAVGRFLGGPVKAVVSAYPEISTDIDSAAQYLSATEVWNRLRGPDR